MLNNIPHGQWAGFEHHGEQYLIQHGDAVAHGTMWTNPGAKITFFGRHDLVSILSSFPQIKFQEHQVAIISLRRTIWKSLEAIDRIF